MRLQCLGEIKSEKKFNRINNNNNNSKKNYLTFCYQYNNFGKYPFQIYEHFFFFHKKYFH